MKIITNFFAKIDANHQYRLGAQEYNKGQIDNAIEMFSRAIEKYENHFPSLYARGSLYIDMVRWDKASLDLKKVKEIKPETEQIDFLLGICYCGLGNFDKGLSLLESQIKKTPDRSESYWNRAITYKNIGENEKALIDIDKAIDILRRDFKLYCIKAEILENLNEFGEAEKCFDKAIELEKLPGASLMNKIDYLKRNKKTEKAIKGLDKMIEQYPFDGYLFFKRGELNELIGDNESAKKDFDLALKNGVTDAKEKLKNFA